MLSSGSTLVLQTFSKLPHPTLRAFVCTTTRIRYSRTMATQASYPMQTSGITEPVWIHTAPWSDKPQFPRLEKDISADVCVIGAGISGIQAAYELIKRGKSVALIDAREVLSGETGRTSGHLSSWLDDSYNDIASKHGEKAAQAVANSHTWALNHVGTVSKELGIDCEWRLLPDYELSQYLKGTKEHDDEISQLRTDAQKAKELGIENVYQENFKIRGWDGKVDQRDAIIVKDNATFHPTKYLYGVLNWLKEQPHFQCYTHTRMIDVKETGFLTTTGVEVKTLAGNTITCKDAIQSTNIPLEKLSIVIQLEYFRTYCIAIRIPKGSYEDCLINDQGEVYHYIRFTECDEKDDYLVIGGEDHKVGQEDESNRFVELEKWVRDRFTQAGTVDYKWSGQIQNSADMVHFIGKHQGKKHIYVITGDTGHGLTMGMLGGRLLAEEITGDSTEEGRAWAEVYNPKRLPPLSILPDIVMNDLQVNAQYKRFAETDITDIEDLKPGCGGVLNATLKKPIAVYKDEDGKVTKFSAICPHLKGMVCWNPVERSFDCPIHGSRFSKEGICVMGPSKAGLAPADEQGEQAQGDKL